MENDLQPLLRYGTRALWSLPPHRVLLIKRRAAQLNELNRVRQSVELEENPVPSDTSAISRTFSPLVAGRTDSERLCMILQKRIAEYAREISHVPGLSIRKDEVDSTLERVIGNPKSFARIATTDILQSYIGAYIYDNILQSKDSLYDLEKQDWERKLEVWLRHLVHMKTSTGHTILTLVMDTALSFKAIVDDLGLRLTWPRCGVDFDDGSMVSWSCHVPPSSTIALAISFTLSKCQGTEGTDTEGTDDEGTDGPVVYPSTVILQTQEKPTKASQADEIERLRHLLTSDRRIWTPIQSSTLQVDRDWCGFVIKESQAEERDLQFERPTKRLKV